MSNQPTALRLAEWLDTSSNGPLDARHEAAAELRRLHAENAMLWEEREEPHAKIDMYIGECNRLERERDALLEALREYVYLHDNDCVCSACAAIAQAEGQA